MKDSFDIMKAYLEQSILESLIAKAKTAYGENITPCHKKKSFSECITYYPDCKVMLWFNDRENSTHIVTL